MMSRIRRCTGEAGSLPLALVVTILVGGLVVVLVARTMTAQNQVRFDQVYHGALPGADAAIQISKARLNLGFDLDLADADGNFVETRHPRFFEPGDRTIEYEGGPDEEGRTYTWTMEKLSDMRWQVDATAVDVREGVERRVLAVIEEKALVDVAAYAETLLHLLGANTADSYDSDNPAPDGWCTGRGWVASNNIVEFSGMATSPAPNCDRPTGRTVDRVFLFDWDADDAATVTDPAYPGGERCDYDSKHPNCTEITHNGELFAEPRLIEEPLNLGIVEQEEAGTTIEFISEALSKCWDGDETTGGIQIGDENGDWFATADASYDNSILDTAGNLLPADKAAEAMISPEYDLADGHYCANSLTFDDDVYVSQGASRDEPVIIFVENEVILDRGTGAGTRRVDVGCPSGPSVADGGPGVGCQRGEDPDQTFPEAASLIIFVQNGQVALRNHSQFAGVMYAPRATCRGSGQGGGTNAQADIYGAMLCDTISNAGGWRFHFDEALANLYSGQFFVTDWREVPRE